MGKIVKDVDVKVAFAGVPKPIADKITERLVTRGEDDPGRFEVVQYADIAACRNSIELEEAARRKNKDLVLRALCIWYRVLPPVELAAAIGDIRVINPLVPICLVGTKRDLDQMPGMHEGWRMRFEHYYRIISDTKDEDFDLNVSLIRDLLVADAIKVRALGHLDTMPGEILRLRQGLPIGFWIIVTVTMIAAILGPLATFVLQHLKN